MIQSVLEDHSKEEVTTKLIDKCWEYATKYSNKADTLKACEICHEILPQVQGKAHVYSKYFTINIDEKEFKLPGYYKALLSKESDFFNNLFKGTYKETLSENITLKEIDPLKLYIAFISDHA